MKSRSANRWIWLGVLKRSGAFDTVYSSYLPSGQDLVLLRWISLVPTPAPMLMRASTAKNLIHCEEADRGKGYAKKIRESFPNGIEAVGRQQDIEQTQRSLDKIYGT